MGEREEEMRRKGGWGEERKEGGGRGEGGRGGGKEGRGGKEGEGRRRGREEGVERESERWRTEDGDRGDRRGEWVGKNRPEEVGDRIDRGKG